MTGRRGTRIPIHGYHDTRTAPADHKGPENTVTCHEERPE